MLFVRLINKASCYILTSNLAIFNSIHFATTKPIEMSTRQELSEMLPIFRLPQQHIYSAQSGISSKATTSLYNKWEDKN